MAHKIERSDSSGLAPHIPDALAPSSEPHLGRREDRTDEVSRGSFCKRLSSCFSPRKVFTAVVVSAAAVGVLFLLVSNPVGWMIAAVALGTFAVSLLAQMAFDKCTTGSATGKLFFEYTAFWQSL